MLAAGGAAKKLDNTHCLCQFLRARAPTALGSGMTIEELTTCRQLAPC